jgi:hypothetical protein
MGTWRKGPGKVKFVVTVRAEMDDVSVGLYHREAWVEGEATVKDLLEALAQGPWTEPEEEPLALRLGTW